METITQQPSWASVRSRLIFKSGRPMQVALAAGFLPTSALPQVSRQTLAVSLGKPNKNCFCNVRVLLGFLTLTAQVFGIGVQGFGMVW